jgi:metal-responsive CopG/Arc/MetJ family transcriptional regulator
MKTAVSIPDDIFQNAERLAQRLRKPRSQLYTEALREYLVHHDPDAITQALNSVYDELGSDAHDPAVGAAARRTLQNSEW